MEVEGSVFKGCQLDAQGGFCLRESGDDEVRRGGKEGAKGLNEEACSPDPVTRVAWEEVVR